ncbi:PREDICTED: migration and invasion-inhibitory protein isoform X3 [Galeopterus variegatus]|uniref:Migration and invasion-inhibitory protein isoform X3 n=1 Tax=Galeopterus variegatus TaxID=482537 RepID=A0ABM0S4Z8_GALVR|nr:PREDICTED: migration and invasion-inhibitory protein isoform X3 [Galeopterus variegatus]
MVETEDPALLRLLSLELLRQLWVGQDAMRRSVALAASESSLDSGSSYDSETPLSPETSSASSGASPRQGKCHVCGPSDAHQGGPYDMASSSVTSLPPANCRHQESPGRPRPHLAPLQATSDSDTPEPSAGQSDLGLRKTQALKSILARQSKLSKPRVTFCKESGVPEKSWRLRPYLGYDWIAGVFCYRVNRRLFLVPLDPGTPCRLCRTPRDQRGPETLVEPVQVRVSVPLSILDPPHRYRIHRRKSFDASDTLALPRHCLLGWDILPPKSEKSSAPKCLDLWSSVSSKAQHQKLSAASPSRLALPVRVPPPTPTWSEPQLPQPRVLRQKP